MLQNYLWNKINTWVPFVTWDSVKRSVDWTDKQGSQLHHPCEVALCTALLPASAEGPTSPFLIWILRRPYLTNWKGVPCLVLHLLQEWNWVARKTMWYFCNAGLLWTQESTLTGVPGFPSIYLTPSLSPWPSPVEARELWRFCTWHPTLCEKRQRKGVWCVSDRSPGSAAGERLTWPVWSWKLTRLHWKWLLLGMAFILVYLLCVFLKPFLKVFLFCFCTNGSFFLSCVDMCLQEHLSIPFSCFLSLQGKVVTSWCRLWILIKSSFALGKRCLFK